MSSCVFSAGGLEKWIFKNTSFTSQQARVLVNQLAEAGLEDTVAALVESAFEAGVDEATGDQS